jgi:hypothetical protein
MAHIIFLLHGMGGEDANWANDVMSQLTAKYSEYKFSKGLPFAQNFKFEPIFYDNVFEKYLKEWDDNAAKLSKWGNLVAPLNNKFVKTMTEIAEHKAGDSFMVRYIGDVLLYMLTNIREKVKDQVLEKIAEKLEPGAAEGWSIVSHSLGTRVMTDVLEALFTDKEVDASVYGKARVVMTVANVSYLLQKLSKYVGLNEQGDVYHNVVFPSSKFGEGVCGRFINAAHDLDPFLFFWPFDPPSDFGNASGRVFDRALYDDVRLKARDLTSTNPHDLGHYLHHPDVHQALFQALVDSGGPTIFTDDEKKHERENYYDETLENKALDKVREGLQQLSHQDYSDLDKLIGVWKQFATLTKGK